MLYEVTTPGSERWWLAGAWGTPWELVIFCSLDLGAGYTDQFGL